MIAVVNNYFYLKKVKKEYIHKMIVVRNRAIQETFQSLNL